MISECNKQHLSNIEAKLKKGVAYKKKPVIPNLTTLMFVKSLKKLIIKRESRT